MTEGSVVVKEHIPGEDDAAPYNYQVDDKGKHEAYRHGNEEDAAVKIDPFG